jgi:transcriptional regulator with XRE-family HTH domain
MTTKIAPRNNKGKIARFELEELPLMSGAEFKERREATGVSQLQLTRLTDISRQRIARIERDDQSSLYHNADGLNYVPRSLVLALIAIEEGILVKGVKSVTTRVDKAA